MRAAIGGGKAVIGSNVKVAAVVPGVLAAAESQVRTRLSAGGRRIRTRGSGFKGNVFIPLRRRKLAREPQPVVTTDNGRFTVGRARLALAMIFTQGHEPPEGANARPCQTSAILSRSSFKSHGQIRLQPGSVLCNAAPSESGSAGCNIGSGPGKRANVIDV
jgi:hypothetical protein